MTSTRLALRVLRGSGVAGLIRFGLMVVAIGIGLATVVFVGTIPGALSHRGSVVAARAPSIADQGNASFAFRPIDDSWHGQLLSRLMLSPLRPDAPPPPGTNAFPRPGQVLVSPALARALATDADLASRIPGTIAGQIAPDGLQGPDELVAFVGVDEAVLGDQPALGDGWYGYSNTGGDTAGNGGNIGIELALLVAVPALGYLLVCARLSAATRSRRYASLRLLGLRRAEILRVAAIESAVAGAVGAFLGVGIYRLVNPAVAASGIAGFTWYPQWSAVGSTGLIVIAILVVLAAAAIGAAGIARGLKRPLISRYEPPELKTRWWLAVPMVLGVALVAEPLLLQQNTPGHPQRLNTASGVLLMAGLVLCFGGLLLALRPILAAAAERAANSSLPAAIRIAARRLELAPTPVLRLLTGLVLLVLVAGTGAGILRDLQLAAGPTVTQRLVTVSADRVPASARGNLFALDASMRWASFSSVVEPPHGRPLETAEDYLRYVGVGIVVATCAQAQDLAGVDLSDCHDGGSYRIVDTTPDPSTPKVAAGTTLTFLDGSGANVSLQMPTQALSVDLPPDAWLSDNTILVAGSESPIGWPAATSFNFLVPGDDQSLDGFKTAVARLAPAAEVQVANQNLEAVERYEVQRGAVTFGAWVGFLLGCLAFLVAMVDRAVDRRRDVVSLAVLGMSRRKIRLIQLATVTLPLVLGLGLAALVGNLVANAFLRMDGRQLGWFQGSWQLSLPPVIAGLILAALSSLVVPGARPRAEDLRRE